MLHNDCNNKSLDRNLAKCIKGLNSILFDLWILLLEMYSFSVFNITFSLLRKKKKKEWDDTKEIKVQGDREGLGNVWDEKHGGQN